MKVNESMCHNNEAGLEMFQLAGKRAVLQSFVKLFNFMKNIKC